jgi:hypothetical protein
VIVLGMSWGLLGKEGEVGKSGDGILERNLAKEKGGVVRWNWWW